MKCEDNRVMHVHDRTEKPVESSTNTHTVQEFGSPEHRDTASSNANKFNLAIDDENIDFNISGVPNAMVKTITWHQRSELDSADRESPSTTWWIPTRCR